MPHKFAITDVFAEGAYGGNQLATLFDAADISSAEMQQIARAFNFAETTFVTGGTLDAGFDVRIFTPTTELPFAGHPTLGTASLIRDRLVAEPVASLTLNLGVGPIAVEFADDGVVWMQQVQPEFSAPSDGAEVLAASGLDASDLDAAFPVQQVSTGLPFLVVPLGSQEALKRASPPGGSMGVLMFARGGYDDAQHLGARMFAGGLGVTEDAATGSANGCLAAWLVEHRYFGDSRVQVTVGQGYEIGRPSQLYLDAAKLSEGYSIRVGGKVRLVAEGQWLS